MRKISRIAADAVLGAALFAVGGCQANDGYYGESGYDYYGYDAHPAYYRDAYPGHYHDPHPGRYYRDRSDYYRAVRRHRVPRDAEVVANGQEGLMYTPDSPGRVYVRDERTGKVIYRDRVQPGQKLNIDPQRRRIEVDGRTERRGLSRRPREREVFFRPDRGATPDQPGRGAGDGRRQKSGDEGGPRERREHRGNPGKGKNKDSAVTGVCPPRPRVTGRTDEGQRRRPRDD